MRGLHLVLLVVVVAVGVVMVLLFCRRVAERGEGLPPVLRGAAADASCGRGPVAGCAPETRDSSSARLPAGARRRCPRSREPQQRLRGRGWGRRRRRRGTVEGGAARGEELPRGFVVGATFRRGVARGGGGTAALAASAAARGSPYPRLPAPALHRRCPRCASRSKLHTLERRASGDASAASFSSSCPSSCPSPRSPRAAASPEERRRRRKRARPRRAPARPSAPPPPPARAWRRGHTPPGAGLGRIRGSLGRAGRAQEGGEGRRTSLFVVVEVVVEGLFWGGGGREGSRSKRGRALRAE